MHAIRSRARHIAWSEDDPPPYSYFNPFRRIDSRPRELIQDEEQGRLSLNNRNHSDGCVDGSATRQQRDIDIISSDNQGDFGGPKHAYTAPPLSSHGEEPPTPGFKTPPQELAPDPQLSNPAPVAQDSYANGDSSLKKRHRHFPFLGKKETSSNDEIIRHTNTSESKKKVVHYTFWGQIRAIFGSWINIILICVPLGIILHFIPGFEKNNPIPVFVINFLAIMPLAGLLSYSTEEIALRVGETVGGLLNASFGNAVELIVSIIALVQDEIVIVQTSLIGSILSNLLLVMGMCFFFGGLKREEQFFNVTVAQTAASLLSLAVGALIIPTVFHRWGSGSTPKYRETKVPALSRGTSIILLIVYGCYLFFQLKTHKTMYNAPSQKAPKRRSSKDKEGGMRKGLVAMGAGSAGAAASSAVSGSANDAITQEAERPSDDDDDKEVPQISLTAAILTLCVSTAFIGWNSDYMVSSIAEIVKLGGISPEFVGLILIPIVGNAAEHATAVTVAVKDKMDLAIGVAVGSSMQIALLVLPLVVIIGWIIGNQDMTLEFDGYLLALLFISVLLVNYLIGDGRSHWLEGTMLLATYVIIAVSAWFYPAGNDVIG